MATTTNRSGCPTSWQNRVGARPEGSPDNVTQFATLNLYHVGGLRTGPDVVLSFAVEVREGRGIRRRWCSVCGRYGAAEGGRRPTCSIGLRWLVNMIV